MAVIATPFAAHVAVPAAVAPAAAPAMAPAIAPSAGELGLAWPARLSAPWPLPDVGLAVGGRPGRMFAEGTVAVVRGVTAADVAAGLRHLAACIERGDEAVVRVDAGFACEAERVRPAYAARGRAA
jgi:hypothetical protein